MIVGDYVLHTATGVWGKLTKIYPAGEYILTCTDGAKMPAGYPVAEVSQDGRLDPDEFLIFDEADFYVMNEKEREYRTMIDEAIKLVVMTAASHAQLFSVDRKLARSLLIGSMECQMRALGVIPKSAQADSQTEGT